MLVPFEKEHIPQPLPPRSDFARMYLGPTTYRGDVYV